MKKLKLLMICLWSAVAIALTALLVLSINGNGFNFSLNLFGTVYKYSDADEYNVGAGSVDSSNIQSIDISWLKGEVKITTHDGSDVILNETNCYEEDTKLRYMIKDNALFIKYFKSGLNSSVKTSKTLEIKIPSSFSLSAISLDVVDVDIYMSQLECDELELDGVDCELLVRDSALEELNVDCVDADLTVEESTIKKIDCDGVDCKLDAELENCPNEIDFDTVSGNVYLLLPSESGYTIEMDSIGKNLSGDFNTVNNNKAVYGDGSARFKFDGVGMSVEIKVK